MAFAIGAEGLEVEVEFDLSELPQLIRDVLARVGDRAVRADDDLVGLVLVAALVRLHRHDPAACVAPLDLEAYRARSLHPLEGVRPEEVQYLGLARQEVVSYPQARHRVEVAVDDARGDVVGERRRRVAALFERVQGLDAQLQAFFILFRVGVAVSVEEADARVQVPAVVVERVSFVERGVERAHVFERHPFEVDEADDHVGHLDAGVVYVVVDFRKLARRAEDADEGVADDGVAQVADVRGLVRVDARVLDHALRALPRR